MDSKPTVFIVDDDQSALRSVSALASSIGLDTETFPSAESFLSHYQADRPGCLVTDLRMHEMSGTQLQEELLRRRIELPIILITAYAETSITVRAMQNGAVTLLEKPPRDHELIDAIRNALGQDSEIRSQKKFRLDAERRMRQLSQSEKEVMNRMIAGQLNKVIARELDISVRTVEMRRHNIFKKTETKSIAELVKLAIATQDS